MKHFIPKQIDITDSSIGEGEGVDETIHSYVLENGYSAGVKRYKDGRLWETYTNVKPLANFEWNDNDPLDTFATNLFTKTKETDFASIAVLSGSSVVYIHSLNKYFEAIVTGDIDFITEDWNSPINFIELIDANYRYLYNEPKEDSLYWNDIGATNRHKCADKAYNSQSVKNETEVWWEFEIRNVDKVVLFNIVADSAKITIYTSDINSPIFENTKLDLVDTSEIYNWRTYSQFIPTTYENVNWTLPFFTGIVTIRITISNPTVVDLKLGEILAGQIVDLALTLDKVPIKIQSSGKIIEQENGDILFLDEGDTTKVYHVFNYTLIFKSETVDSVLTKCDAMINRRIVVFSENTDEVKYRSLVVYGFSRDISPTLETNSTQSKIKFKLQRFI